MQITGSHSFAGLRKPSSTGGGQEGQKLVFLYPVLFDMTLLSYQDTIRDLLTVDFIGQIKSSNVLNIVSNSTRIGNVNVGDDNYINPAQEVRKNIGSIRGVNDNLKFSVPNNYIDYQMTSMYQQKIDTFLNFIKNQIENDPRYKKFRPLISSLTLTENLINIPLIVGTKVFQIESEILYWFLLISILFNLPLDKQSNINRIKQIYESIPENNRLRIILYPGLAETFDEMTKITHAISRPKKIESKFNLKANYDFNVSKPNVVLSNMDRYIRSRINIQMSSLSKCVNRTLWDVETDFLSTDTDRATINTVGTIDTSTQNAHFQKAFGSFQSYISNSIIPILYGLENLLGPFPLNSNVTMQDLTQDFIYNIVERLTGKYVTLSNHITNYIRGVTTAASDTFVGGALNKTSFKELESHIKDIYGICDSNVSMTDNISNIIQSFNYNSRLPINFNGSILSDFLDNVTITAGKMSNQSKTIIDWLDNILRNYPDIGDNNARESMTNASSAFHSDLKLIKLEYTNSIDIFFDNMYPSRLRTAQLSDGQQLTNAGKEFVDRFQNFSQTICNLDIDNVNFKELKTCRDKLTAIVREISISLSNILQFFFLWNFLSYLCGYIQDIDIDIQIQKRDVLDFPNYTLVVPIEIINYIYALISIQNFRQLLTSNKHEDFRPKEGIIANVNDVNRMIEVVTNRLNVPNIIIINRKKKEILYKFMYMSKANKGNVEQLKSYISHQSQVLPGF